jgi:hypothetical protein
VLFLIVVVLFHLLNARAARIVGDRWGIDASVPGPRLALVIALDALIIVAFGIATGVWAAVALLPVAATIVMMVLRAQRRSQTEPRSSR